MSETGSDHSQARWLANLILLVSAAMQLTRILQVQSATGEVPFLSANDRSRWCTIAALSIQGRYEIDDVLEIRDPKSKRRTWYSIDLVRHRGTDGKQHYYSSKPPLLPTLYTGVYLGIREVTRTTLMDDTFVVARIMLVLVNLIPLVAFWWLMVRWFHDDNDDDWSIVVKAVFIGLGTYLSTFVISLNNHLPAAIAVGVSLWCLDRIAIHRDGRMRWYVLCGLCTSFGAANELPALGWVAAAAGVLLLTDPRKTLLAYIPSLAPVALAFFGCNYLAHNELKPAYAHRSPGKELFQVEAIPHDASGLPELAPLRNQLKSQGIDTSPESLVRPARMAGVLELWDPGSERRFALTDLEDSSDKRQYDSITIQKWGDWYDYPGSYWTAENKQGVDRGEPNRSLYIFHCLLGHHGIFSLTPIWLLVFAGGWSIWRRKESANLFRDPRLLLFGAILATTIVVVGFYFARGLDDRNYGGVSSGFRWSFWLIPLWFWVVLPWINSSRSSRMRRVIEILLILSVFSACYPWRNPWTSPWLMQLVEYLSGGG